MTKTAAAKKPFVIVLDRTVDGPVYLGRTDVGRQGVRRIENAIRYATRVRAELVASDYGTAATVERTVVA